MGRILIAYLTKLPSLQAALSLVGAFMACATVPTVKGADLPAPKSAWQKLDADALPDDDWGRAVRYGRDLISKTSTLIGPEVANPEHRYAGNNLNCQNCHLEAATKEFGLPFQGVYADFPNYRARSGTVGTIEDRIQGCMVRSMNGQQLPPNGQEMTAMVAYLKFLSTGYQVGGATTGRGAGNMPELTRAADIRRGATVYAANCTTCHGQNGEGQRIGKAGDAQGYLFPPLWGPDSYNDGAGMHRLIVAANFIHANMPNGSDWRDPVLPADDAWDVAAYINAQPRPRKAHLEQDYPKREQKPVDAPYGPYADNFSEQQHRLGPFAPIRDAAKKHNSEGSPAAD
jgi:thiosulfate dehydrogenase